MRIVSVREHPEFADAAISYVSACWPEGRPFFMRTASATLSALQGRFRSGTC